VFILGNLDLGVPRSGSITQTMKGKLQCRVTLSMLRDVYGKQI